MKRGSFRTDLTAALASEWLTYDPETGEFRHARGHRSGKPAGYAWSGGRGYRGVSINGAGYFAHRVAWLIFHGEWPKGEVDHINGDKGDNRIANLRDVPKSLNQHNRPVRRDSASGVKGVWKLRDDQWRAFMQIDDRVIRLGTFKTKEEAAEARRLAGERLLPPCPAAFPDAA